MLSDRARAERWLREARASAEMLRAGGDAAGGGDVSPEKFPTYERGLCVMGSFIDGELQCTADDDGA
jgi:hypothetical protein|eukprot:COSAG01_NODE_6177_length_3809_cov_39.725876_7_plen_67_part_00